MTMDIRTEEGRREWLAARRKGIGSSDAAAILGLSPWATPLHVYLDKHGQLPDNDTPPKKWGRKQEEVVATAYEEETGRACFYPANAIEAHPDFPWMLASLDRVAGVMTAEERVVELKTVGYETDEWGVPGTDEVPTHYQIQVQHQLAVTGFLCADLAVLFAGQKFRVYHLPRNERLISQIIAIESDFWARVTAHDPPDLVWTHPKALELLGHLYGGTEGEAIELPGEYVEWAQIYLSQHARMKEHDARKMEAKVRLLDAMGSAAVARLPGGFLLTRQLVKRKGFSVDPTEYIKFKVRVKES